MSRWSIAVIGIVLVGSGLLLAQQGPQRATIKKVDAEKGTVTLTVDGKDREFRVMDKTRLVDDAGKDIGERLKDKRLKPGVAVMFLVRPDSDPPTLMGMKLGGNRPGPGGGPGRKGERITKDTSHLKPLTDLGAGFYQKFPGGLYPDGKNERPEAHEAAGLKLAKEIRPRDAKGKPDPDGKIVLVSIGMSNTSQVSEGFARLLKAKEDVNPAVVFVNGAQGGMTAAAIQDPETNRGNSYWSTVDRRLKLAGVTREQVQAAWIKQADAGPSEGFPGYARKLQGELAAIVRVLHDRFPNLKIVYLSSRTYGGYATTRLNPEPYAYESGFAVKWLIEQQIKGEAKLNYDPKKGAVKAPWLSWGPYLWANGKIKRGDGFSYEESDYSPSDGTHLSSSGTSKTGGLLLKFLETDSTAKLWFQRMK
jgi:hypothetical protein